MPDVVGTPSSVHPWCSLHNEKPKDCFYLHYPQARPTYDATVVPPPAPYCDLHKCLRTECAELHEVTL